ncbi:DUF4433 domain-containing protein [Chitinophaga silvatica]|uniref:DUF4433 domain-containing protein n=1 Tax=Chitinophaga silvatica TaxID=2282649 RepID=A0A3E1YG77_9BACT|nr:DarT ssDNA thymidine ADP-ribosyltransferase family protein [Chitinophaga silvatica]RFS26372.1 DUF4433 domain-containing protein [Chitinophaga silvatica]
MDSSNLKYITFPFEWTLKSTSYQIRYRKAFSLNEIDEIFCSIINTKGNNINFSEFGILLGFNLQDQAEKDILQIYLKSLTDYNLIEINHETIHLTELGQEALQSNLKYRYYSATTGLFENQTAKGENFDFSFESVFNIKNELSHDRKINKSTFENPELQQKLQFQLFGNDPYQGEIVELYKSDSIISYKSISLECKTLTADNSSQLTILKSGINKPDIELIINLPENEALKSKLLRMGMFHYVLSEKNFISLKDIETYIDLWDWKELAENSKLDWNDQNIFKLFLEYGDRSIWASISKNAPLESIKSVIREYAEFWNWTTLTERLDNNFIKEHIENFNWDFEELSYKETEFITSLLLNIKLKNRDWDWNYISKNLPDEFIEKYIEDFPWDFYTITENKNEVFKNTFIKYRDKLETLISKNWNWKYISEKININFLHKNISALAKKLDWHTVLSRFFNNEEISAKCLNDESFKILLKKYSPEEFVIAHQKYIWTPGLIDFFEQQNLIQWESKSYIKGFDTNKNVDWNNFIFQRYHNRIATEDGFLNVSQHISDGSLIEEFPDFNWNWEAISQNKMLINNISFIENAFVSNLSFSNKLIWNTILLESTFDVSFWNKNLEKFHKTTDSEKQTPFWKSLTKKENSDYIFSNPHFPWDWSFITENSSKKAILDSFENVELFEKWDWKIATQKLDKEDILNRLEDFARFIDWKFIINEVFTIENELIIDKQLPRIAACLSVIDKEIRIDVWKTLTAKIPFETLFPMVEATNQSNFFEWDWDFISNHKHFPTDIKTLNQYRKKINWTIFTESHAIRQKFNPDSWDNGKQWFSNIDRYLNQFEDYWDWQVLSRNRHINYNRIILQKYKTENWDWDYLTEYGGFLTEQKRDNNNKEYLEKVLHQFPKINFEILSKREDINIDSRLLLSTKDKNWDWQVLSENKKVEISNELILELKDKNWNWQTISKNKNIEFSNVTILQLLDKNLDWNYISDNNSLEFNIEFIEKTKTKSWNWEAVSRHKSFLPTTETLTLTKDFEIDWEYISKHSGLNPTKEILAKFETQWHWYSITENPQINFDDIDFIERFKNRWNWHFICESGKVTLNEQVLTKFKKYLNWNLISSNTNIQFTTEIIQEFKQYWNWTKLKENKRAEELLGSYVTDEICKSPTLNFIDKIEQQYSDWKGSIYHFSHIENAVEIIKNRKIQSRNKANIKGDAAGNVVHLRDEAHDYARFYFRPQTPTQFYNEFLGKNTTDGYNSKDYGWVSWYEKARGLGFPKCPIPIFFKFSLKEVLFKNKNQCCISNGNMQTSSTKFGNLENMINKFGFEDLYYTPKQFATKEDYNRYRNYAQQEFLVKDELSFNDLSDFEIICSSASDKTLLTNLLGNEHKDIISKIVINTSYYNNHNPRVIIEKEESKLHISTNFKGEGYFVLNGTNIKELEILTGNVSKIEKDKIIFNSYVSLGNLTQIIRLNFIDESKRNWFIYTNGLFENNLNNESLAKKWQETVSMEFYNPIDAINLLKQNGYNDIFLQKIRHYKLETHTNLVCNTFEKYFAPNYTEYISLELFRTLLILHDIGKTNANIEGDKNKQYEHTKHIVKGLWQNLHFSEKELSIILAILDEDYLGNYFQSKLTLTQVRDSLYRLSKSCGLTINIFFNIYMIYYQCDIASYTTDEGGFKFLEHLFEYQNGKKLFEEMEGLLKMAPEYWGMYKQLKTEIENVNQTYKREHI